MPLFSIPLTQKRQLLKHPLEVSSCTKDLFQLKRGEQVTVVGDPKTDAQGTQWVYIKHEEHGYGWCQLRSLERLQD